MDLNLYFLLELDEKFGCFDEDFGCDHKYWKFLLILLLSVLLLLCGCSMNLI